MIRNVKMETTMKIHAACFSPAGATREVVMHLAASLDVLRAGVKLWDFTLPAGRLAPFVGEEGDLVVVGMPVYAGRLPNLLVPYLKTWQGKGAYVVPVVVYGNRSYGNALIELRDILTETGFRPLGAAAFVGEHAFAPELATGRPDAEDLSLAERFAGEILFRLGKAEIGGEVPEVAVPGIGAPDYGGYYQPLGEQGEPVRFLKAKPETTDACTGCGRCADVCPMGSIDKANPAFVPGVCIKCSACIRICPVGAKQLVDPAFQSHVRYLKAHYVHPAKSVEWF